MIDHALPLIIIFDESLDDRARLRRLLRTANLTNPILTFARKKTLLEYLESSHRLHSGQQSVLFVSVQTPDGPEVLRWLTEHTASRPTRVVVLANTAEQKVAAAGAGADDLWLKFPPGDVIARLAQSLQSPETLLKNAGG